MIKTKEKKPLDNGSDHPLGLEQVPDKATRQLPANKGGIKIDDDMWSEFILVSKYLILARPNTDVDIYDLFTWIREEINGCQPLSDAMIAKADAEIERELGPWI